jgi:hypothetical protein
MQHEHGTTTLADEWTITSIDEALGAASERDDLLALRMEQALGVDRADAGRFLAVRRVLLAHRTGVAGETTLDVDRVTAAGIDSSGILSYLRVLPLLRRGARVAEKPRQSSDCPRPAEHGRDLAGRAYDAVGEVVGMLAYAAAHDVAAARSALSDVRDELDELEAKWNAGQVDGLDRYDPCTSMRHGDRYYLCQMPAVAR